MAVPPGVEVVVSRSNGAVLEAVFDDVPWSVIEALKAAGFAWCKPDRVMLRVSVGRDTRAYDLATVGALRVGWKGGVCVLSPRAYLPGNSWCDVNGVCVRHGFVWLKGVGWKKTMTAQQCTDYVNDVNTQSNEVVERMRRRAAEAVAVVKQEEARERAVVQRAAKRAADVKNDDTYQRRLNAYGKLLLRMQRTDTVSYGSDCAPNWPDPPKPGEKGIVSDATAYLMPSPSELSRAEAKI
jgi:hypothetical protein